MTNQAINTEEQELHKRLVNGDETVIERLVEINEPMILSIANQFTNQGLTQSELIEAGTTGFVKCAKSEIGNTGRERYFRFVKQEIQKLIIDKTSNNI